MSLPSVPSAPIDWVEIGNYPDYFPVLLDWSTPAPDGTIPVGKYYHESYVAKLEAALAAEVIADAGIAWNEEETRVNE